MYLYKGHVSYHSVRLCRSMYDNVWLCNSSINNVHVRLFMCHHDLSLPLYRFGAERFLSLFLSCFFFSFLFQILFRELVSFILLTYFLLSFSQFYCCIVIHFILQCFVAVVAAAVCHGCIHFTYINVDKQDFYFAGLSLFRRASLSVIKNKQTYFRQRNYWKRTLLVFQQWFTP